jgi:hypothetical protein
MTRLAACSPVAAAAAAPEPYSDTGVREGAMRFVAIPDAGSGGRSERPKAQGLRSQGSASGTE